MMKKIVLNMVLCCALFAQAIDVYAQEDAKLSGTIIGTDLFVDYSTFEASTTVNTREMAFDGDLNTCFATYDRSQTWVGLDLGEPYVITRVGWSPRNDGNGPKRVMLAVFEGSNSPDFLDALPLYVVKENGTIGEMSYGDVTCSKGFRYVRYVGPADARCNVAEVEFYGHPGAGDDKQLVQVTNLPTVSIHVVNNEEPYDKENELRSFVSIISENGTKLLKDSALVRLRGNASMSFPKKPYRIKFDKKYSVLGAPSKAKKWTLINNYGDKTLMRNQLAFELSRRFGMPYTPFCAYVDVLVNGEYKGCYQLCDQIEVRKGRVDIEEMTPEDNSGEALTGGYLVEADAYASSETNMFWSDKGTGVTIKSPDEDDITYEQYEYIRMAYSNMENNWRNTLDTKTFLKHFLVGEMSGNTDTYWSVYFYKHRGNDTIFTGPVWDFDLAFENDNRTYPIMNLTDYIYRTKGSTTGYMKNLANQVAVNDAQGKAELKAIWAQAREAGFTEENFLAYIDEQAEMLQESQRLNFIRWPIMNTYVHQNPRLWGSYEAEVANVKRYVSERIPWMDNKLNYVYVPTDEKLDIVRDQIDSSKPYVVYSMLGQRVGTDMTSLPKGVYIVAQGQKVVKIVIP
ncbi:MAG: CotH kinase family protein [Paludibacteraceae bacterium]|nr:CotH kinase family protein [Paludibacteraceae bacterium]